MDHLPLLLPLPHTRFLLLLYVDMRLLSRVTMMMTCGFKERAGAWVRLHRPSGVVRIGIRFNNTRFKRDISPTYQMRSFGILQSTRLAA